MSTIPNISTPDDANILSVSQISAMIQNTLTTEFSGIRIRGEISGLKVHTSGHVYFSLKDENAVISAICWRGQASKLNFRMEEGLEVIAYGNVNTYPARSNYQIICTDIRVAGVGALMAMLEERKKKLAAEGLFDPARKKALPYMPQKIGVITSPTGAVIKDILHRISERFGVHVLVYPVAVQGEGAAEQVAAAIEFFNNIKDKPDVLIVARGGGSIEDLWAFNEEVVVRAAANSNIPLISAVGHETDTTLIDFASDKRAPTPTAAAEMAVPVKSEIINYILDLKKRSFGAMTRHLNNLENILKARAQGLISPKQMLANITQRLDDMTERLTNAMQFNIKSSESILKVLSSQITPMMNNLIKHKQRDIESLKALFGSYDYKNVLKRGFAMIRSGKQVIASSTSLSAGDAISIEFFDGSRDAMISGGENKSQKPKPAAKQKSKATPNIDQGDLF